MPTKSHRIQIVLDKALYQQLKRAADREGLSMSRKARNIIHDSLNTTLGNKTGRPFTGKHFKKLIGKFDMGNIDYDEILVSQVHG